MSQHEDLIRLRHMLDHALEAHALIGGKSWDDLHADRVLSLALVRLLEVVGEAASRTSTDGRARYPAIPWPQVIGLRNRLIHAYDAVDLDILWKILTEDVPPLIVELEKAVAAEGDA